MEMVDMFHKFGGDASQMDPVEVGEWAAGFGQADHDESNTLDHTEFTHWWDDSSAHEDILFQEFSNEKNGSPGETDTGTITLAEWLEEFGDADDVDYFWSDGAGMIDYSEFKDWYTCAVDTSCDAE